MATQRYAPVRLIASSSWIMPDRLARRLSKIVSDSRRLQATFASELGDEPLAPAFAALRSRAVAGGLASVLPDALALAALAAERLVGTSWEICGDEQTWEMKPRDNQLACAAVLARGDVAELDTGEGKTLCAAMAAACWALIGRVHVVTANDYLAWRDFEWMGPLLDALGLTIGSVQNETPQDQRRAAYQADVTYVSVKEVGADYLRDTLTSERQALNLPALETAILDEVDFILVDEARIPLILAEQIEATENLCHQFNEAVAGLLVEQEQVKQRIHREIDDIPNQVDWSAKKRKFEATVRLAKLLLADPLDPRLEERFAEAVEAGDGAVVRRVRDTIIRFEKRKRKEELLEDLLFIVDRRVLAVQVTEGGLDRLHGLFGDLFNEPVVDPEADDADEQEAALEAHRARLRAVHNLLAGHVLYRRDRDYIIEEGRIVLVDQSTGRPTFDRHLQHGLHRALEAKEGLYPALDHQTAAEITFPGLFQLYNRFCGTSGTCLELSTELKKTLKKGVVRVPPHRPVIRADCEDVLFRTVDEKAAALVAELQLALKLRQPVLIGTSSVAQSEWVSAKLDAAGIPHQVLNARHHEREARIIARAGEPGTITVATTMAGRGTDIRPPADLAEQIADAAVTWVEGELSEGRRRGFRIQLFSEMERETFMDALRRRDVAFRVFRRRKKSTIIDIGSKPGPTAFPLSLGLRIIGFERLGASRLDRQLRGRTGRQGAPGSTRFYLALDDETVLIHADRSRLAELRRKSRPLLDPLSNERVRSGRRLAEAVKRAWRTLESLNERQRDRLNKLDAIDQAQRHHYDGERRSMLFADDEVVSELANQAIKRAAHDLAVEVLGDNEFMNPAQERVVDDFTQVLFERRGLIREVVRSTPSLKVEQVAEALRAALARIYAVARESHGPAMAQVERTVLLDALTQVWRQLASERPDLRQQSDLYAYANKQPADIYRKLAGQAYHGALAAAARTAASVLVTFPLPREIKTQRTGLAIDDQDVLELVAGGE